MNYKNNEFTIMTKNYTKTAGVALRNEFERRGENKIILDEVGERCYGRKFINTKYEHYIRTEIHYNQEDEILSLEVYFESNNNKEYVTTVKKQKMDEKYFAAVEFNRILDEWDIQVINISGKHLFIIWVFTKINGS